MAIFYHLSEYFKVKYRDVDYAQKFQKKNYANEKLYTIILNNITLFFSSKRNYFFKILCN